MVGSGAEVSDHDTASWLGIVGLGRVCAAMQARNLELFQRLGAWVVDTTEPELQRLFAEACHRHAWHVELWAERVPTIPGVDLAVAPVGTATTAPAIGQRAAQYAAELDELVAELSTLAGRVDDVLDPSTTRTLALVTADLTDLRRRLRASHAV